MEAYLHVPIHPSSRKYLRFTLRGREYQFKALAFGLLTSPLVFTCLMSVIATFLRARAITLHPYLDDWLTRNQNRRVLLEHRQFLLSLINSLGLIINYEKLDLVPAQVFTFIGMEFLTQTNVVRVPQDRVLKILETVRQFSQKYSVSARDFLSLLGQLGAAADFVMLGRLHLRPLQMSLLNQWRPHKFPLNHQIDVTTEILHHLKWWQQEDLFLQGVPLKIDPPISYSPMPATQAGGGGSCGARGTSVSWSMDRKSISAPHQHIRDESNFSISNTSPSHCEEYHCNGVNRQHYSGSLFKASGRDPFPRPLSGSLGHSEHVLKTQHPVANKAHSWPVQHPVRPNEQNGQTDHHRVDTRSRNSQQSIHDHGLSVHRPVCHKAKQQVASVCVAHTGPTGVINRCSLDGLESHSHLCVSSFPSNSSCDKKVQSSQCKIVLIAPLWPDRPWFPELLHLLVSPPVYLPEISKLLTQLKGKIIHQNPGPLQLHTWELSNNHSEIDNFRVRLQTTSPRLGESRPLRFMMRNGRSSVVGLIDRRPILSRPLPK